MPDPVYLPPLFLSLPPLCSRHPLFMGLQLLHLEHTVFIIAGSAARNFPCSSKHKAVWHEPKATGSWEQELKSASVSVSVFVFGGFVCTCSACNNWGIMRNIGAHMFCFTKIGFCKSGQTGDLSTLLATLVSTREPCFNSCRQKTFVQIHDWLCKFSVPS